MRIMKTNSKAGLKVNTGIKAGGIKYQHNRSGLKVSAGIKAGGIKYQHNRRSLKVSAGITAGYNFQRNHSQRPLAA